MRCNNNNNNNQICRAPECQKTSVALCCHTESRLFIEVLQNFFEGGARQPLCRSLMKSEQKLSCHVIYLTNCISFNNIYYILLFTICQRVLTLCLQALAQTLLHITNIASVQFHSRNATKINHWVTSYSNLIFNKITLYSSQPISSCSPSPPYFLLYPS